MILITYIIMICYSSTDLKRLEHVFDILESGVKRRVRHSQVPSVLQELDEVKRRVHFVLERTRFQVDLHETTVSFCQSRLNDVTHSEYGLSKLCVTLGKWIYRVAQKNKPLPNDQKIVLKIANEIRFLHEVKV